MKRRKFSIRMTQEQFDKVNSLADENKCSISHIISNMIDQANVNEIYKEDTKKAKALIRIINIANQIDGAIGDELKRLVGEL